MTNSITIAAIDPSLTSTGVVVGTSPDDFSVTRHQSKPRGKRPAERLKRYEELLSGIASILDDSQPKLIVIEGYSYGSQQSGFTQAMITEFGGLLRWHLCEFTSRIAEVPPSTLKKFVTGKGNCGKELMLKEVFRRWQYDTNNNDEADAYGLFRMGLVMSGQAEPETVPQAEAVAKVMESHSLTSDLIQTQAAEAPF